MGRVGILKPPVFYCMIAVFFGICLIACGTDRDVSTVSPSEEPAAEMPEAVKPQPSPETTRVDEKEEVEMDFILRSSAFGEGAPIPLRYTCEGENVSPYLTWMGVPDGTVSFTLIVEDPDAPVGVFTHWILFNIPSSTGELMEGTGNQIQPGNGALHGKNDMNKNMYGGPCPPPGKPHRYRFTLYALDITLDLTEGISKKQALEAMEGHVLARNTLTGTYER